MAEDADPEEKMHRLEPHSRHTILARIKKLANKPEFICKVCGRLANEANNLCQPESLKCIDTSEDDDLLRVAVEDMQVEEVVQKFGKKKMHILKPRSNRITLRVINKLAGKPKFICTKCGRLANEENNLCQPRSLSSIGTPPKPTPPRKDRTRVRPIPVVNPTAITLGTGKPKKVNKWKDVLKEAMDMLPPEERPVVIGSSNGQGYVMRKVEEILRTAGKPQGFMKIKTTDGKIRRLP